MSLGTRVHGVERGVRFFKNIFRSHSDVSSPWLMIDSAPFFFAFFFFWFVERLRSVVRAWTCLSSTSQNLGKQQQEKPQQSLQSPKHYKRTGKDDNHSYY